MDKLILVRYGEIALKGNNRNLFENRLIKNIKMAIKQIDQAKVTREHGRIFIRCQTGDYAEVVAKLGKIFGIVSFSPADVVDLSLDAIAENTAKQLQAYVDKHGPQTFKIETRRPNKAFAIKSPEISRRVGAYVLQECTGLTVDVHQPQVRCDIEVRSQAYIYTQTIPALGGMPYKTAGKAMLLLSGGIDSPVAGYLMAKRGLEIEAIHFHSYPFTSDRAYQKIIDLAKKLVHYIGRLRIHSVNILEIQRAIGEHCPSEEMTILSRRAMMKIATVVAAQTNCQALVTGENLGQVASQTIEGINVTSDATNLPVFRPLIAMDKRDIVTTAQQIDTYDTSILPFEDCCTVFLPKRVVTKPRVDKIIASERTIPIDTLVEQAVAAKRVELIDFENLDDFEL